jgi:hypothetical protein
LVLLFSFRDTISRHKGKKQRKREEKVRENDRRKKHTEMKHNSTIKHKSIHLHYLQWHYKPVVKVLNKFNKCSHLAQETHTVDTAPFYNV